MSLQQRTISSQKKILSAISVSTISLFTFFAQHVLAITDATPYPAPAVTFQPAPPPQPKTNAGIATRVRTYFADIPVMIAIAQCESAFRQYNSNGSVLRGGNGSVVGVYQISELHLSKARALGMDIYSVDGNLAFARWLYQKDGIDPWMSSFPCWNAVSKDNEAPVVITTMSKPTPMAGVSMLSTDLYLGVSSPEVVTLQQLLNHSGFIVAESGAGSPGQESSRFGLLTRAAVRSFQCAKGIACSGDEYTTGYGFVDARTRAALVSNQEPAPNTTLAIQTAETSSQPIVVRTTQAPNETSEPKNLNQMAQIASQIIALAQIVSSLQQQLLSMF